MLRRQTYRCYPTPEQEILLAKTFGCCRYVYNWGLALRTAAFHAGAPLSYGQTSAALTRLKKEKSTSWLKDVSCVPLQQELQHLETAFGNFFAKRAEHPTFKQKGRKDTAEYTRSGFTLNRKKNQLILAKMNGLPLKLAWSRPLPAEPSSLTVIRKPSGRYFVSFVVECPAPVVHKTGESIAIDFGISRLATLSNGEQLANPKHGERLKKKLAREQRKLAKKQCINDATTGKKRDSKRRALQKRKVARVHERIANARNDNLHKLTTNLVRRFDMIYVEDLHLRGMVKNHALARSLHDTGIGTAIRMLEHKAQAAGKTVVRIDRWYPSSKICSTCGYRLAMLALSVRNWTCPKCGAAHDRDENAAKNLLAVGKTVIAHGEGVSVVATKVAAANSRRSANRSVIP
jgi:putative transposase